MSSELRSSPLADRHVALKARMVAFGGWQMPLEYRTGTLAEHLACRRSASVFDVSHLGTVRLDGRDAYERLQRELTNDLGRVGPGRAQYSHLLDDDGSVVDDLIVWWVDEATFNVMPNASNTSRVIARLGGADVTAERAVLAVQGPAAREVLGRCFPAAAAVRSWRVETLPWGGGNVVVAGTGYTGEDGVECSVPITAAGALWDALVSAGAMPAGLGARDTLRLEAGLPLHGHELGPGTTPLEAGLGWVVAWGKPGGFVGRAALEAKRAGGAGRTLQGVLTDGRRPLRAGYSVEIDGEGQSGARAGPPGRDGSSPLVLTSGNYSPVLERGIGMAFLPAGTLPGTPVRVETRGGTVAARAHKLPFLPKHKPPGTGSDIA